MIDVYIRSLLWSLCVPTLVIEQGFQYMFHRFPVILIFFNNL